MRKLRDVLNGFEPSFLPFALDVETEEALRRMRNRRRKDKKAGRSPTPWNEAR